MHQQPPQTPLYVSTSRAKSGHVTASRGRTTNSLIPTPLDGVLDDRWNEGRPLRPRPCSASSIRCCVHILT